MLRCRHALLMPRPRFAVADFFFCLRIAAMLMLSSAAATPRHADIRDTPYYATP